MLAKASVSLDSTVQKGEKCSIMAETKAAFLKNVNVTQTFQNICLLVQTVSYIYGTIYVII